MTRFLSTHKLLKAKKICSQQRKNAHKNQICSEQEFAQKICSRQKFAHRICSQHRKTAHNLKPSVTQNRCKKYKNNVVDLVKSLKTGISEKRNP
jgi:hypothetical protein